MLRFTLLSLFTLSPLRASELEPIQVAPKGDGFVTAKSKQPFSPWGFNYDHDAKGRLIEDYWFDEWDKIETDFVAMKKMGANVVRIHLQLGKVMSTREQANEKQLAQLKKLLELAEKTELYLDLTGLGCYHKKDVPEWYDALDEKGRWEVQTRFWSAVAKVCKGSPAVFCFDLMNEPVSPAGNRKPGDWLGPAFGGKHFVQMISLEQKDRPRPEIARDWIRTLRKAIRNEDETHLITVGLVDWSLDRKGLTSGFVPEKIFEDLDFLCVHLYPEKEKVMEAIETLKAFNVGKPVVIEETFPLKCGIDEFANFVERAKSHSSGLIGFYWGKPMDELRKSKDLGDQFTLGWLEFFTGIKKK
jgi:hypothetical protein